MIVGASGNTTCETAVVCDFNSLELAVSMYKLNTGVLPLPEAGLRALVERPPNLGPDGHWDQLLSKVPTDPWGNAYCYVAGDGFPTGYGIYSSGPDGRSGTQGNDSDDFNNWSANHRGVPNHLAGRAAWTILASAGLAFGGFWAGAFLAKNKITTEQGAPDRPPPAP